MKVRTSDVSKQRKRIRDKLGVEFERKATDAFCLAFTPSVHKMAYLAEAVSAPEAAPRAAILEFSEAAEAPQEESASPRPSASALTLDGRLVEVFPREVRALQRQERVVRQRARFLATVAAVHGHLEASAGGLLKGKGALLDPTWRPGRVVETCWLNRTLRVWASGRALAEVASHPSVRSIDAPRRLRLDMDVTAKTVNVAVFRKAERVDGRDVKVAVIDMEVDKDHPALAGRVVQQRNYSGEPWGNPGDHGTAVAGIIASSDARFAGMAPAATVYNYKVFRTDGGGADDFYGARALQDALEDGVHVANCSWGAGQAGDGTSREARACDNAWALGLVVVKSAGNNGPAAHSLTTPADAEGVIVVGATNRQGTGVPSYSSRGPTADGRTRPHLLAPGGTEEDPMSGCLPGGGFGAIGYGTSFAAPHVSGIAALFLQKTPALSPDLVRQALIGRCRVLPGPDPNEQGSGLIRL